MAPNETICGHRSSHPVLEHSDVVLKVLIGVSYVLLAVYAVHCCFQIVHFAKSLRIGDLWQRASSSLKFTCKSSPMELHLRSMIEKRRTTWTRKFVSRFQHVFAIVFLGLVWKAHTQLRTDNKMEFTDILLGEEFVSVFLLTCMLVAGSIFPGAVRALTIDACHTILVLHLISHFFFTEYSSNFLYRHEWVTVGRAILAVACGNSRLVLLLSVIAASIDVFFFAAAFQLGAGFMVRESTTCVSIYALALLTETKLESEIRSNLTIGQHKLSNSNMSRMLASLCDAVVEMDQDLLITSPVPKLSGLLLHGRNLQGCRFESLLHEEDRDAFVKRIMEASPLSCSDELAPPLHVRMHAATSIYTQAEVFITSCLNESGAVSHILGIVDQGSPQNLAKDDASVDSSADAGTKGLWAEVACCGAAKYTIVDCSDDFALLFGRAPAGHDVSSWMSDSINFSMQAQTLNNMLRGLTLQIPFCGRSTVCIRYTATCTLSSMALKLDGTAILRLVLTDIAESLVRRKQKELRQVPTNTQCMQVPRGSSVGAISEISLESGSDIGEIACCISDVDMCIINCTPGFTRLCGPITNTQNITTWMPDPDLFVKWMQQSRTAFREVFDLQVPCIGDGGTHYNYTSSCTIGLFHRTDSDESLLRLLLTGSTEQSAQMEHLEVRVEDDTTGANSGRRTWPPLNKNAPYVVAWLDVSTQDLRIVSRTPGFAMFDFMKVGTALNQFVVDQNSFLCWLQECCNHQSNENTSTNVEAFCLRLRPTPCATRYVRAMCMPDFESPPPVDLDRSIDHLPDARFLVCIVFKELCYRSLNRSSSPKGNNEESKHLATALANLVLL